MKTFYPPIHSQSNSRCILALITGLAATPLSSLAQFFDYGNGDVATLIIGEAFTAGDGANVTIDGPDETFSFQALGPVASLGESGVTTITLEDGLINLPSGGAGASLIGGDPGTLVFNINGGSVVDTVVSGDAQVTLNDGNLGGIVFEGSGVLNLNGGTTDFVPVANNGYILNGNASGIQLNLSGSINDAGNVGFLFTLENNVNVSIVASAFGTGFSAGQVLTAADLPDDQVRFDLTYPGGATTPFPFQWSSSGDDAWTGAITLVAVPEPGAFAACAGVVAFALVAWRRRR